VETAHKTAPALSALKPDFPLLAASPGLHYLDSAATSQKPRAVLDAMRDYYERDNANPHRGAYALSGRATDRYHAARERVARFLGVGDSARLVFTRGTTESLNLVASSWGRANVQAGDELVVTGMEHHANFVPWQQLAIERGARLRVCEVTADGRVDLDCLAGLVGERTRVVAFNHVSNALGTINPVREIARVARERSGGRALVVCDGAQAVPHLAVRVDELDVDFYAFSGHKMCGPTGIGGLWARREVLEAMPPFHGGGDMIEWVDLEQSTYAALPHKFEAGTPNIAGAVGLAAAADYLAGIGRDRILAHERSLIAYAVERMGEIPDLRILGPRDLSERSGVVSFTLADVHPHDLATILDSEGVAIRAGHHCCQPLMKCLGVGSTARASFYLYNTPAEVDALVDALHKARGLFGY
jgi:cysteine desulfurase/selenocysteine lyase